MEFISDLTLSTCSIGTEDQDFNPVPTIEPYATELTFMFGGYFIECCWNTPSDFLGGLWKGVQIEKKLENNGIDLYHVC